MTRTLLPHNKPLNNTDNTFNNESNNNDNNENNAFHEPWRPFKMYGPNKLWNWQQMTSMLRWSCQKTK